MGIISHVKALDMLTFSEHFFAIVDSELGTSCSSFVSVGHIVVVSTILKGLLSCSTMSLSLLFTYAWILKGWERIVLFFPELNQFIIFDSLCAIFSTLVATCPPNPLRSLARLLLIRCPKGAVWIWQLGQCITPCYWKWIPHKFW